jgi:hypothetical protein
MPIQRQPVCDERNNQMSLPQLGQVRCERQPLASAGFFLKKGYEIFWRHFIVSTNFVLDAESLS